MKCDDNYKIIYIYTHTHYTTREDERSFILANLEKRDHIFNCVRSACNLGCMLGPLVCCRGETWGATDRRETHRVRPVAFLYTIINTSYVLNVCRTCSLFMLNTCRTYKQAMFCLLKQHWLTFAFVW